jgi:hypothetical protein
MMGQSKSRKGGYSHYLRTLIRSLADLFEAFALSSQAIAEPLPYSLISL